MDGVGKHCGTSSGDARPQFQSHQQGVRSAPDKRGSVDSVCSFFIVHSSTVVLAREIFAKYSTSLLYIGKI
jgi:hypothetical protein